MSLKSHKPFERYLAFALLSALYLWHDEIVSSVSITYYKYNKSITQNNVYHTNE